MTIDTTRVAGIARQVLAIIGITMAVLTQTVTGMKLPVAISTAIALISGLSVALEQYLAHPSTGNTITQTANGPAPVAPVAIVPQSVPTTVQ